ncbi:hypothetical protein [Thermotoga caldifontis]|uniref:hypothetical protein n=1 Tax=Thermotoga caldifontis TaxID=1508419 RepID=UPI00059723A3|nr:hypothetical protein [Thermotoga caldifontis]
MKRTLFSIFVVVVASFALAQSFIELYLNSSYFGRRIVVEKGPTNKSRIEMVYRWPNDKIVHVLDPVFLVWAKHSELFIMGQPNNYRNSPLEILDLEDLFIRQLKERGITKLEKLGNKYKVTVESPSGLFTAFISETGLPEKIIRVFNNVTTELTYEHVEPLKETFEQVAQRYGIKSAEQTINLPSEIKLILGSVNWYTVSRLNVGEEQVLMIIANHKSGSVIKMVCSTREVTVNTEQNEQLLRIRGENYYLYVIAQDQSVLEQVKELLTKER